MCRGQEGPLCDPGSELLLLGGRASESSARINKWDGQNKINKKTLYLNPSQKNKLIWAKIKMLPDEQSHGSGKKNENYVGANNKNKKKIRRLWVKEPRHSQKKIAKKGIRTSIVSRVMRPWNVLNALHSACFSNSGRCWVTYRTPQMQRLRSSRYTGYDLACSSSPPF